METIVRANVVFALSLYQKLGETDGNIFFSPYSLSNALAMTYAGSRGETEKQMAEILAFKQKSARVHAAFGELNNQLKVIQENGNVQLNIANSLWPDKKYPFLTEYLLLLKQYYAVLITGVDYGQPEIARQNINAWVAEKTRDKIEELIGQGIIDHLTRLVITNAIYFKGNWARQFDEANTEQMPFWVTQEEQVQVAMMRQVHEFRYAETNDMQILEMPYLGDEVSMVVLLPKAIDGLDEIGAALSVETLDHWTHNLQKREIEVFLPKFKMQSGFRLDNVLESMGMTDAFDEGKADFSGMDGIAFLFISAVLHKAYIEVNEEGTEATAATAVIMGLKSIPPPPVVFRVSHPFIFLIREKTTGSILFLGRMLNPGSAV